MLDPSLSVSPTKDHPYSKKRRANLLACILDKQPIICAKPKQSEFIGLAAESSWVLAFFTSEESQFRLSSGTRIDFVAPT
jgi:hypothetical protein